MSVLLVYYFIVKYFIQYVNLIKILVFGFRFVLFGFFFWWGGGYLRQITGLIPNLNLGICFNFLKFNALYLGILKRYTLLSCMKAVKRRGFKKKEKEKKETLMVITTIRSLGLGTRSL